jgi:ATP-dependent Clp protease ATP-binding subunit ClpA
MDKRLLALLAEGEHFLLALQQHDQDEVTNQLGDWRARVEQYVAQMPEQASEQAQQKGASLMSLVQRLEQAFKSQAEWIQKQQYQVQQQHLAAQKYTKNT